MARTRRPLKYVGKVDVRLTPEEDMALRSACSRLGLTRTEVIRRMIVDFIDTDQRRRNRKHFLLQKNSVQREAERQEAAFT